MREDPILLGFLPKHVVARPEGFDAPGVEEICSVSTCISPAPDEYVMRFDWNAAGFYDTEAEALACIPDDGVTYRLFAYRIYPWIYDETGEHPFSIEEAYGEPPSHDDLEGYRLLGYDIVEKSGSDFFECSPLSCNGVARETPVNAHCLVETLDEARRLGVRFGDSASSGVEPSPYFVFEVRGRV